MTLDKKRLYSIAYEALGKTKNFKPALFGGFITANPHDGSPIHLTNITKEGHEGELYEKALGKLAMEACYWMSMSKKLNDKSFNVAEAFEMFMVCLIHNGKKYVILSSLDQHTPYHLKLARNTLFYDHLFNGFILVDTPEGEIKVPLTELGLTDINGIYRNRQMIDEFFKNEFSFILKKLLNEHELFRQTVKQHNIEEIMVKIDSRESMASYWSGNQSLPWDVFYFLVDIIDNAIKYDIQNGVGDNEFYKAVVLHAQTLNDAYVLAQQFLKKQKKYSYPISQSEKFILLP